METKNTTLWDQYTIVNSRWKEKNPNNIEETPVPDSQIHLGNEANNVCINKEQEERRERLWRDKTERQQRKHGNKTDIGHMAQDLSVPTCSTCTAN